MSVVHVPIEAFLGALAVAPQADGWWVGEIVAVHFDDAGALVDVAVGDVHRPYRVTPVDQSEGLLFALKEYVGREAGTLRGRRFDSRQLAWEALQPYVLPVGC